MPRASSYISPKLRSFHRDAPGERGVLSDSPIGTGEILVAWGGVLVPASRFCTLPPRLRRYSLQVEEELFLVPRRGGEPADFVNHSCDPNAGLSGQMVLVALRDIRPGEEICYDYAMSDGSDYDEFDCACGAAQCRGRVTGADWQRGDLQQRYAGYFSPYLVRRMMRWSSAVGAPRSSDVSLPAAE